MKTPTTTARRYSRSSRPASRGLCTCGNAACPCSRCHGKAMGQFEVADGQCFRCGRTPEAVDGMAEETVAQRPNTATYVDPLADIRGRLDAANAAVRAARERGLRGEALHPYQDARDEIETELDAAERIGWTGAGWTLPQ